MRALAARTSVGRRSENENDAVAGSRTELGVVIGVQAYVRVAAETTDRALIPLTDRRMPTSIIATGNSSVVSALCQCVSGPAPLHSVCYPGSRRGVQLDGSGERSVDCHIITAAPLAGPFPCMYHRSEAGL